MKTHCYKLIIYALCVSLYYCTVRLGTTFFSLYSIHTRLKLSHKEAPSSITLLSAACDTATDIWTNCDPSPGDAVGNYPLAPFSVLSSEIPTDK